MKHYRVRVREVRVFDVEVTANNEADAEDLAELRLCDEGPDAFPVQVEERRTQSVYELEPVERGGTPPSYA